MAGILRKDLRIQVNGFWMILVLEIGEIRHSLVCFGVMELVSHISLLTDCRSILTYLYVVQRAQEKLS